MINSLVHHVEEASTLDFLLCFTSAEGHFQTLEVNQVIERAVLSVPRLFEKVKLLPETLQKLKAQLANEDWQKN